MLNIPLGGCKSSLYTHVMTISDSPEMLLEAALHAIVMRRCERAYLHELRDGLQGVAVSVDAMSRVIAGKAPASLSGDKVAQIAKRALHSHEQELERVVRELAMTRDERRVEVSEMLRRLAKLLRNDAAVRQIAINVDMGDQLQIETDAGRLRLVLLSVAAYSIDTMPGGAITVTASADDNYLVVRFTVAPAAKMAANAFRLTECGSNDLSSPSSENWLLDAAQRVARAAGGDLDISADSLDDAKGYILKVKYQARRPSDAGISL